MLTREQLMADSVSALCATPVSPFLYTVNNKVRNKHTMEQLKHKRNPNVVAMWIIQYGEKNKTAKYVSKNNKRNVLCVLQLHFPQ